MLVSLNWLREFVPFEGTAEQLGAKLTMLGLELEDLHRPYDGIKDIVVGKVLTCVAHPQSDHLHVCTVDAGTGEVLPIVCGAPNVAAGQTVPVAPVGTTMPGGMEIKAAKLRGERSLGMICSERELGLSESHDGIMVLPDTFKAGEKLVDALDLDREILEIGITPNRSDCLSILGYARETAMAFNLPLTLPSVHVAESGAAWVDDYAVDVSDPELCPSYRLRMVDNVSIAPSPAKIRYRLNAVGVRAISNIVDVTNYVMMELGQPLHAFDGSKLKGHRIIVSPAVDGERIITLDGQERRLVAGDLLIRDTAGPVAIAGVMGGLESEMDADSTSVMIECAVFRPATIRRTARRLALSSEASYRYERGVDQTGSAYALDRAAQLMAELSGGTIRPGVLKNEGKPWTAPVIPFRRKRAEWLLGINLDEGFCRDVITGLGCLIQDNGDGTTVTAPGWRPDLTRECDLIEEVARVHGMDRIPETLPARTRPLDEFGSAESDYDFILKIKRWGTSVGMNECENYSFVSHKDLDLLHLPKQNRVTIVNPLSEEQDTLRPELLPGLLTSVRHNLAHGNACLRLFEVANGFTADTALETSVHEDPRLAIVLYGPTHDGNWPDPSRDMEYADVRGIVEHFASSFHVSRPVCTKRTDAHPYLSPCVTVTIDGKDVGVIGRVNPQMAGAFLAKKAVWGAELSLTVLRGLIAAAKPGFTGMPVYPASTRDITVIADSTLSIDAIPATLNKAGIKYLEQITLIDVFEPDDRNERNLTFRLVFRRPDGTLKDQDVDKERERAAQALVSRLAVRI